MSTDADPGNSFFDITPHDSNAVARIPRAVYVGVGGDIVCRGLDSDSDVTLKNVPSGALLPIRPKFIRATDTTATDLVGIA